MEAEALAGRVKVPVRSLAEAHRKRMVAAAINRSAKPEVEKRSGKAPDRRDIRTAAPRSAKLNATFTVSKPLLNEERPPRTAAGQRAESSLNFAQALSDEDLDAAVFAARKRTQIEARIAKKQVYLAELETKSSILKRQMESLGLAETELEDRKEDEASLMARREAVKSAASRVAYPNLPGGTSLDPPNIRRGLLERSREAAASSHQAAAEAESELASSVGLLGWKIHREQSRITWLRTQLDGLQ